MSIVVSFILAFVTAKSFYVSLMFARNSHILTIAFPLFPEKDLVDLPPQKINSELNNQCENCQSYTIFVPITLHIYVLLNI